MTEEGTTNFANGHELGRGREGSGEGVGGEFEQDWLAKGYRCAPSLGENGWNTSTPRHPTTFSTDPPNILQWEDEDTLEFMDMGRGGKNLDCGPGWSGYRVAAVLCMQW